MEAGAGGERPAAQLRVHHVVDDRRRRHRERGARATSRLGRNTAASAAGNIVDQGRLLDGQRRAGGPDSPPPNVPRLFRIVLVWIVAVPSKIPRPPPKLVPTLPEIVVRVSVAVPP